MVGRCKRPKSSIHRDRLNGETGFRGSVLAKRGPKRYDADDLSTVHGVDRDGLVREDTKGHRIPGRILGSGASDAVVLQDEGVWIRSNVEAALKLEALVQIVPAPEHHRNVTAAHSWHGNVRDPTAAEIRHDRFVIDPGES